MEKDLLLEGQIRKKYEEASNFILNWFGSEMYEFETKNKEITDKAKKKNGIVYINRYVRRNSNNAWDTDFLEDIVNNNYMRQNIEKPAALVVANRSDFNNAFEKLFYPLNELNRFYHMIVIETFTKNRMFEEIERIGRKKKLDIIMLCGHGNQEEIHFGKSLSDEGKVVYKDEYKDHYLSIHDADSLRSIKNYLSEKCIFILNSCLCGKGNKEEINLANVVKDSLPFVKVLAFKTEVYGGIGNLSLDDKGNITHIHSEIFRTHKDALLVL